MRTKAAQAFYGDLKNRLALRFPNETLIDMI